LTHRQEAFVRGVVRGKTQRKAYVDAGYAARGDSADACASRMLSTAKVKRRVKQIAQPAARRAGLSIENLIVRIGLAIEAAEKDGAHGAVAQNHVLLLKIVELVREDEAASAHMFQGALDAGQIAELYVSELGGAAEALEILDDLRVRIEQLAGQRAIVVSDVT
jgi:hypothetical protein